MAGFVVLAGAAAAASAGGLSPERIVVSDSACAQGWAAAAGRTRFVIKNTARNDAFSVQLVDGADPLLAANPVNSANAVAAANARVYGQVNLVAPGTAAWLDVVLPPGRYFFRCIDSNGTTHNSQVRQVSGPPVGDPHPYSPVTPNQLALAMHSYRLRAAPVLGRLLLATDRLTRAVRNGKLSAARRLWLPAHLDYACLGVAYGTFGDLDGEIDGRPLGLVNGVEDRHFEGFLRLEYGLWHNQSRAELAPIAVALDRAVHTLIAKTSSSATIWVNSDLPLRAHEILENTLQFELTGETDEGSHTNLATAWANARGERLALEALGPLLRERDPVLFAQVSRGTARLTAALSAYKKPKGLWESLGSLTTAQREKLNSATSELLEQLEQLPGQLQLALLSPTDGDG